MKNRIRIIKRKEQELPNLSGEEITPQPVIPSDSKSLEPIILGWIEEYQKQKVTASESRAIRNLFTAFEKQADEEQE